MYSCIRTDVSSLEPRPKCGSIRTKGLTDQHVVEVVHGAVDDPVRSEGYAELVDDLVVPGLAPSAPAGPASVRVRS